MSYIALGVFFLLLLIAVLVIYMPLSLSLRLTRKQNRIEFSARIKNRLFPGGIEVVNPVTKMIWSLSRKPFRKRKKPPEDLAAKDVPWGRVMSRVHLVVKLNRYISRGLARAFALRGRPKLGTLKLHTEVALQDAAETAISTGLLWSLMGLTHAGLATTFDMRDTKGKIEVIPRYEKTNHLDVDYYCIIEFYLSHIIIIVYRIFRNIGEIKEILRRFKNE